MDALAIERLVVGAGRIGCDVASMTAPNVSPGMAERSLFPAACAAAGLSLSSVLNELVSQYAK